MPIPVPGLPNFGDLFRFIELCHGCVNVLKNSGEAGSEYEQCTKFLQCLHITIKRAMDYVANNPNSKYTEDLKQHLELIAEPWNEFRDFLEPYEPYLGAGSAKIVAAKVPKAIKFAMKEVVGEIEKLKVAIVLPLNSMLFLITMQSL